MKDHIPNTPSLAKSKVNLTVTSCTSQGARDYQEDACGHWFDEKNERLFAVVADGAGGHGGGAEAAQAAITSATTVWKTIEPSISSAEFLEKWMGDAHQAVNEAAEKIHRSARAVVVACLTDGEAAHWVHAGDSRLLRFHEGKLVERTRDDSVVQVLFERGEISEEEMGTHPDQSRLLQSLGGEDAPSPRAGRADMASGDVLLLCSDGFWEHLKQYDMERLVSVPPPRRQAALDEAVAEAVRRSGAMADNTTAIMIHFGEEVGSPKGMRWALLLLIVTLAVCSVAWLVTGTDAGRAWVEHLQQLSNQEPAANQTPTPPPKSDLKKP